MLTDGRTPENDKDAALALSASETRYRRLFEAASDGILILDADSGSILDTNPSLRALVGYRRDDLPGKQLWQIGLSPGRAANDTLVKTLRQRRDLRLANLTVVTRSGLRRQVELIATAYDERDGRGVIQCHIRDITERKDYEAESASANALSSIVLESMTDAFFMLDRDWCFTYINEQAEHWLRRSAPELVGQNIWDEFPDAVGSIFETQYRRALEEQVVAEFEAYFPPLEMWVDVRAFPSESGLSVYFTDITLRKKAERALHDSEERLRSSADGSGLGLWQYVISTQKISYTPHCFELYGLPPDGSVPITNEFIRSILHPDDVDPTAAALRKAEQEASDFEAEYRVFRPDGSLRWIRAQGKPYLDASGHLEWIQGVLSDVTPRKLAEAQRDAADRRNERIVETLQRSLIQVFPGGSFAGIDVECLYVPAPDEAEAGGDFFDAFSLGDAKIALVVGDVSGKGLDAVARTSEVKYVLRAFLHEHKAPEIALARLNAFLCATHRSGADTSGDSIAIALFVVDTLTGEAAFSAAGAKPALILRGDDGASTAIDPNGSPLGVETNATFTAKPLRLEVGDTILIAANGIVETRRDADRLGIDGIAALAEAAGPAASLSDLGEAIHQGVLDFAGDALRADTCLLLARRTA